MNFPYSSNQAMKSISTVRIAECPKDEVKDEDV